jgi:hypothetical protein
MKKTDYKLTKMIKNKILEIISAHEKKKKIEFKKIYHKMLIS